MKKIRHVIAAGILSALLVASSAVAANAVPGLSDPIPPQDAKYINELLKRAGQPSKFQPAPGDGNLRAARGFVPAPYNCELFPSKVHVRTKSGEKKNVGAKPYTKCDKAVSHINQVSNLYIVEWAGIYYRPMKQAVVASNSREKSLTQQNVQYFCKNNNNSLYVQTTNGVVTINTRYYSSVTTRIDPLACGY